MLISCFNDMSYVLAIAITSTNLKNLSGWFFPQKQWNLLTKFWMILKCLETAFLAFVFILCKSSWCRTLHNQSDHLHLCQPPRSWMRFHHWSFSHQCSSSQWPTPVGWCNHCHPKDGSTYVSWGRNSSDI